MNPFPYGYERVRNRIHHVHLKDPVAIAEGTAFTRIGQGAIDYVGQFRALERDRYDGVLSIETHYRIDGALEPATRECIAGVHEVATAAGMRFD
jgi:sugar phosphate isomerase/epimerase